MRGRPDTGDAPSTVPDAGRPDAGRPGAGQEVRKRRIDLNVPQVAGSALAAVVAAKLASYFGVYGTILGAGVVSVIATCGGPVFQHFFRRTGEQLRTVTAARPAVAPGPTATMRRTAPTTQARTQAPTLVQAPADGTRPAPGEYTEPTVYRSRRRAWKRPVVAAALVFGVTMGGITVYELVSGDSFSGGHGTTVGNAVTGHHTSLTPSGDDTPQPSDSSTTGPGTGGTATPGGGTDSSRSPDAGRDGGATATPTPTPDPSGDGTPSGDGRTQGTDGSGATDGTAGTDGTGTGPTTPAPGASATTPAPSASSRSGSDAQDPAGPAAQ
ncbi:hypothetical protein [Streptomyces mexicanus]|uniref:hypothetical protein n=1 Tax=Streptomyces mexicanus TaxID=178566 RepID=UPI0031EE85AB